MDGIAASDRSVNGRDSPSLDLRVREQVANGEPSAAGRANLSVHGSTCAGPDFDVPVPGYSRTDRLAGWGWAVYALDIGGRPGLRHSDCERLFEKGDRRRVSPTLPAPTHGRASHRRIVGMDTARVMGDAPAEGVEPDFDPDHIAARKPGVEGERHMLRFQDLGLLGPARTETDGAFAAFQPRRIHHYDHTLSWEHRAPASCRGRLLQLRSRTARVPGGARPGRERVRAQLRAVRRRSGGRRSAACSVRTITTAPSVQDIRSRFAFATTMSPLPDQDDFRVSLNDGEVKRIRPLQPLVCRSPAHGRA